MANLGEGVILRELDGNLLGIDAAGNLILNTKGKMDVAPTGGAPRLIQLGVPFNLAISNAKGGSSNVCNVSFQLQDFTGAPLALVTDLEVYLSDAATGAGLTATTASGGIAATVGAILGTLTASKAIIAQTNASGLFTLAITDSAKTGFYPCAQFSRGLANQVGAQLTAASYL